MGENIQHEKKRRRNRNRDRNKMDWIKHNGDNNDPDEVEDLHLFSDYETDDMTEAEASSHLLRTTDETLPYPKWWGKKKEGKRKRKRRRKKKKTTTHIKQENETTTRNKWNSLPKIWKSFGKELEPGQDLAKTPPDLCSLKPLTVDLSSLGWGHTIISPTTLQANYCAGSCSFPLSQAENPTNHATILSILKVRQGEEAQHLPEPCCVPRQTDSLTLLYTDMDGSIVLRTFPKMSVRSCGRR